MNQFNSYEDELNFIQKIFPEEFYSYILEKNNSFHRKKFENINFIENFKTFNNNYQQIELENNIFLYIDLIANIEAFNYADMNFSTNVIKINSLSSLLSHIVFLITDIKKIISEKLQTNTSNFNTWLDNSNTSQSLSFTSLKGNNYNKRLKELLYKRIINTCKEYPISAFKIIVNILSEINIFTLKSEFNDFAEACILNNPYLINEIYDKNEMFISFIDFYGIIDYLSDDNLKKIIKLKQFQSTYRYAITKKDLINNLLIEHLSINELRNLPHGTLTKESWEIIKLKTI